MVRSSLVAVSLLALFSIPRSSIGRAQDVGSISQPSIIGSDDRQQWYEASGSVQGLVQRSTVMLLPAGAISSLSSRSRTQTRNSHIGSGAGGGARVGLCSDQAFACEPALGSCSGTLIDGHTVVTAGHCFDNLPALRRGGSCNGTAVVFNWRMESEGRLAEIVPSRDVYYCHQMLAAAFDQDDRSVPDFAVFTIKRSRTGSAPTAASAPYAPASISRTGSGSIYAVGHPTGIPVKISPGTLYTNNSIDFGSNLDLFPGNSGGGTFSSSNQLIGIVSRAVRGSGSNKTDQFYPVTGDCRREHTVLTARGNVHVWIGHAIDATCNPSSPHHYRTMPSALCGTAPPVGPGPAGPSTPGLTIPSTIDCSTSGSPSGAGIFLVGLLLMLRRRSRRSVAPVLVAPLVAPVLALATALVVTGCSNGSATSDAPDDAITTPERDAPETTTIDRRYVTTFHLFSSTTEEIGADLDGDGEVDNAFGSLTAALAEVGFDLPMLLNDTVALGDFVQLHRFHVEGDRARFEMHEGVSQAFPDFSGEGTFHIAGTTPHVVEGSLDDRTPPTFHAETDALALKVPFGEGVLEVPLRQVTLAAEIPDFDATLALAGALPERDLVALVDDIATAFGTRIAASPGCPSECEDPTLAAILAAIDTDGDGTPTGAELRMHPVLGPLLAPDLDLDRDGRADHFSFGVLSFLRRASFDDTVTTTTLVAKSADYCNDGCSSHTTCEACNRATGCGFCVSSGTCMSDARRNADCSAENWRDTPSSCVDCSGHTSCGPCAANGFCGWCPGSGTCLNDGTAAARSCSNYQANSCR